MKTAKEYLQDKYPQLAGDNWNSHDVINDDWVVEMMEEYANYLEAEHNAEIWFADYIKPLDEETESKLTYTYEPSIEETLTKMKIKELELSIRLRDLEIERLMNKLNNK